MKWNQHATAIGFDTTDWKYSICMFGYNNRWPSSNNPVLREIPARFTIAEKGAVVIVSPFPTIGAANLAARGFQISRSYYPGDRKFIESRQH